MSSPLGRAHAGPTVLVQPHQTQQAQQRSYSADANNNTDNTHRHTRGPMATSIHRRPPNGSTYPTPAHAQSPRQQHQQGQAAFTGGSFQSSPVASGQTPQVLQRGSPVSSPSLMPVNRGRAQGPAMGGPQAHAQHPTGVLTEVLAFMQAAQGGGPNQAPSITAPARGGVVACKSWPCTFCLFPCPT